MNVKKVLAKILFFTFIKDMSFTFPDNCDDLDEFEEFADDQDLEYNGLGILFMRD